MMKLSLMKRFFDSVDGEWRSPMADEITTRWFASDFHTHCLRASANFAFKVHTPGMDYLLRFNHSSERQPETIAGELGYIEHLAGQGICVSRPMRSLAGKLIESVSTPLGVFHCVLFEFMPGEELELEELDETAIRRWGQSLGKVHVASETCPVKGRPGWQDQMSMIREFVPLNEVLVLREAEALEKKLQMLPTSNAYYGLIHFDFEPDNIVWSDGNIGIFDLDDCAYDWYAMDISNALSSGLFEDQIELFDTADTRFRLFVEGYRSVRNIEEQEIKWMPLFLRLDNLISFARICRSIAGQPIENEPEWMLKLRQKLDQSLNKYRDSFLRYPIDKIRLD